MRIKEIGEDKKGDSDLSVVIGLKEGACFDSLKFAVSNKWKSICWLAHVNDELFFDQ